MTSDELDAIGANEEVGEQESAVFTEPLPVTIQAIIARNDNGSVSGTLLSCADVAAKIPSLNAIFSSTKVSFALDATRDCQIVDSTALNADDVGGAGVPHQAIRDAAARKYPEKLVIIFRDGWGSSSSGGQNFVIFDNDSLVAGILAHEIGHYFGLPHTHPGGGDGVTQADAITTIRNAVNSGQVTLANGLAALQVYDDGFADTPIDLGARAYVGVMPNAEWCTRDLPLPVTTNFGSKTYFSRPPYSNVMSYWGCPNVTPTFSANQSAAIRRTLLVGTRSHLRKGYVAARGWAEIYASPAAVSRGQNEIVVFATSVDGQPYSRVWRSGAGYDAAWFPLNGSTRDGWGNTPQGIFQPATMYRNSTEIDVFSFFMDGHAQSKVFADATGAYWPSNTEWFDQAVTAASTGPSAAARSSTQFMLTLRAIDGTVYARNYDNGYGGWIGLDGKGETRPAVAALGTSAFHAFARWNDGSIRHKAWSTASGWQSTWTHLGGSGEGSPSAIGDSSKVDLFAQFADGTIRTKRLTTSWSPSQATWTNLGGMAASQPTALLAGTARVVVARAPDGGVRLVSGNSAGVFGSWIDGGGRTVGAPVAIARTSTEVVIYARWYDGSIRSRIRDLSAHTWSPTNGWLDLGTPPGATLPPVAACPAFDVTAPGASFCTAACPCDVGEGGCDSDSQCRQGLRCGSDVGPTYGLPSGWDACVPRTTPYDSDNRSESFCNGTAPCDIGQGDCDNDSQCKPGLVCVHNRGTDYAAPSDWDFCDAP